ncbi:MAG: FAD-binding protein [Bacteroidales bacterium]|nr:FAD-binding protein [Bacteroidales bacterium]
MKISPEKLSAIYKGEFNLSEIYKILYATDASIYREIPIGVAFPSSQEEILQLIEFSNQYKIPLIPRGAGTSLAGQVVGNGLVLDFSKYFNNIIEINTTEQYAIVQPGIVLDELNLQLKSYNLFFAPETSTSNRCTIGGMIGNNSCGARSLIYKTTREHIIELEGYLIDGTYIKFQPLNNEQFQEKLTLPTLEGKIYRTIYEILSKQQNKQHIIENYPDPRLHRRNMGYALDVLLKMQPFDNHSNEWFNLSKLIAGSEGTLMIITQAKLKLTPIPPANVGLVCVHLSNFNETFDANLVALQHNPTSVELIDNIIINLARTNKEQDINSFFVEGNPASILIVEFAEHSINELHNRANALIAHLKELHLGYAFPIITGKDVTKVWNLRKAGLGILSNMEGERKPITFIEDTAVHPEYLKSFTHDMQQLFNKYGISCVYYAHIGTGEIHLKPALNLKSNNDRKLLRIIAEETAKTVKKYRGSLSGEHGDGRLRGEFIPFMLGNTIYQWLLQIKNTFDANNLLNPGKIVNTPPMDTNLRYHENYHSQHVFTWYNYKPDKDWLNSIEKCNGSADCRRSIHIGGNMCPTYMATANEYFTTRARANSLREIISTSENPFQHKELFHILDNCISCKACKSECPSNIDMAQFKAEFLQHYYQHHRIPFRTIAIANISKFYKLGSAFPSIFNLFMTNKFTSSLIKHSLKFAKKRNLPTLSNVSLYKHAKKNNKQLDENAQIFLLCDEFTNYIDSSIGIKALELLHILGYKVNVLPPIESGRTYISKGLLKKAKKIAMQNSQLLMEITPPDATIIGIEPSAILTFRDEYPALLPENFRFYKNNILPKIFTIEEFLWKEIQKGNILKESFSSNKNINVHVHVHCQFKAISNKKIIIDLLNIIPNTKIYEIPSSCCGMAGSFGYEKEHYELSMKIGEMMLFKYIRNLTNNDIIVANGTSCRQQIFDGTGKKALHPIELLYQSVKEK